MNGQITANAVAGAMAIVHAIGPEILTGQYVELSASRAFGKYRLIEGNMAF
jgi:hypothetical protein